jgi:DNA-binding beta-propeller fold protein YncE
MPGQPFGILLAARGQQVVVSLTSSGGTGSLAVLRLVGGWPELVRVVPLPVSGVALGMAGSHDGRLLAVTMGDRVLVADQGALVAASPGAFLGSLQDGSSGSIEAAFSADDRFLFVTDETSSELSVYDVAVALQLGFQHAGVAVGRVRVAAAPVGVALSPDGRLLYVTTEGSVDSGVAQGMLWVLDALKATRDPAGAVVARTDAGCQAVRVALSPDGSTAWVTARGADMLVGFDTANLIRDPATALRAMVETGPAPVGLALIYGGRLALVADSNRFNGPGARQTLALIDTAAALAGRPALIGYLPAGEFPREMAVDTAHMRVFVTNYNSDELETVPTTGLRPRT